MRFAGGLLPFVLHVGSSLRRQLDLLRRLAGFRRLFLATLGSGLGTWLAYVALVIDVYGRTGSGTWVSALLIADFLPSVAIGILAGSLVDRLSRKGLMIGSDLVRLGLFCALPFAPSATAIVALATGVGFATGFFRPAVYAGLPNLVDDAELGSANSLLQSVENLTWTIGPLVGGILVAAWGPHVAYWLNAATFAVSAALLVGIPGGLLQAARARSEGFRRDFAAGLRLVTRSRPLLTILVAWNLFMFALAGVNVAEVVLAKVSFHAGDFGYGLLVGAAGLGLTAGSFVAGPLVERRTIGGVYGLSIGLIAAGIAAAAISPDVWVATIGVFGYGFGNGVAVVCNALLVQRGAPDELRGRAFTLLMSANFAVLGVGMIVAGPLTDAVGARWVWGGAAAICAVASLTGAVMARGFGRASAEEVPAGAGLPAEAEPLASVERAS